MKLPEDERLSVSACLRQVDFLDEVPALERALAERALRSPAIRRLMTVPGREREHCGGVHAVGRAASGASIHCASRRLSRPRPARSPVGLLGGPTRPHLEGRLLRGPPHARRGGLVGGDADRTDARLLRAHPGAAVPGRGDRHGGTSCAPLFWHLLTRRRTRPSRGRRSRARSGGSSSCRRRAAPARQATRTTRFAGATCTSESARSRPKGSSPIDADRRLAADRKEGCRCDTEAASRGPSVRPARGRAQPHALR